MTAWQGSAEFHDHPTLGRLRFRLDRWRGPGPRALILMCNASTADGESNDPTIHRCLELTPRQFNGVTIDGITVVNWEPYVASDPADLHAWRDRASREHAVGFNEVHVRNYALIRGLTETAAVRIIAWGRLVPQTGQAMRTLQALSADGRYDLNAFGLTKDGDPKHPMARGHHRIAAGSPLLLWRRRADEAAA